jgi:hypothetical protein
MINYSGTALASFNNPACVGPDYIAFNGVNLSTGIRFVNVFVNQTYGPNDLMLWLVFAVNVGFLILNLVLLSYGLEAYPKMRNLFRSNIKPKTKTDSMYA